MDLSWNLEHCLGSVGTDNMFTVQFQEKDALHFGARNDVSMFQRVLFPNKVYILVGKRHHSFAVPSQNVSEIPEASAFDDFATCVHLLSWLKISASVISRTPEDLHGFSIALVRWRPTVTLAFRVAKWAQRVKLSRAFMHVRPISPWTSLRKSDFEDVNHVGTIVISIIQPPSLLFYFPPYECLVLTSRTASWKMDLRSRWILDLISTRSHSQRWQNVFGKGTKPPSLKTLIFSVRLLRLPDYRKPISLCLLLLFKVLPEEKFADLSELHHAWLSLCT